MLPASPAGTLQAGTPAASARPCERAAEAAGCGAARAARREYTAYEEVAADYRSGALHPGDLKPALARALNAILQPVRDHFAGDERARKLLAQARPCVRGPCRSRVRVRCSLFRRKPAWQHLCDPVSVPDAV